jgi:hypothetical protein
VAGHIELRNHANTAVAGIGDDLAYLIVGIVLAIGAHLLQLGKTFAFDAESLIFREVPMEDVELDGGHAVEGALHVRQRNPVACDIQHQAAPGEARMVFDGHRRHAETAGIQIDQLHKGGHAAQHA